MVFGKFVTEAADLQTVRRIEAEVFEQELGLDILAELSEDFCMKALVFAGEEPAAVGRILFDGSHFKIAGVAVRKSFRGQQYGDFVVRLLVDKALMANAQQISLEALGDTVGLFEKIGFEVTGEAYESLGARWTPMTLLAKNIHKCNGCHHG